MDSLIEYAIPIKGLKNGIHHFSFGIDRTFFQHMPDSPVEDSNVHLDLTVDKRDDMYVLLFDFAGTVKTDCDRCLATIDLPVSGNDQLIFKLSEATQYEDAEVIYISPEEQKLRIAQYVYEFIVLAMPIYKVYDCEKDQQPPCNVDMLERLNNTDKADSGHNPIWEALKNNLNKE